MVGCLHGSTVCTFAAAQEHIYSRTVYRWWAASMEAQYAHLQLHRNTLIHVAGQCIDGVLPPWKYSVHVEDICASAGSIDRFPFSVVIGFE